MNNTNSRRLVLRCLGIEQFRADFGKHLSSAKQAYLSVSDTTSNCWQLPLFTRMQPCLIDNLSIQTPDSVLFAEIAEQANHKSKVIRSEIIMLSRNQPQQGLLGMCEFKLKDGISLRIEVFLDEDNDTLSSEEDKSLRDLDATHQEVISQARIDQETGSMNEFIEEYGLEAQAQQVSENNENEYADGDKLIINLPSPRMKWFNDGAEDRPIAMKQLFSQPIIHLENRSKKKYIDGQCPTLTDFQIKMKPQMEVNPQKSSSEAKEEMTQMLLSRIERTKMYKHPFYGKKTPISQSEETKLDKLQIPSFERPKMLQQPIKATQKNNSKGIDCGINTDARRNTEGKQFKLQQVVDTSYRSSKIEPMKKRKSGAICKRLQSERLCDESERQSEFQVTQRPQMTELPQASIQSIDLQIYSVSAHLHQQSFQDTFVQICIGTQKIRTSGQVGGHLLWTKQQLMFKKVSIHHQMIITLHHPNLKDSIGAVSVPVLSLLNQDYIQLCAIKRRAIAAVLVLDYICKPNLPVIRGDNRVNRNSMGALRRPKQMTKLSQMAPTESSMQLKRYVGGSNVRIGRAPRFGKSQFPPYLNIKMSSSRHTGQAAIQG